MLPVEEGNFWYKIERIHRTDLIKQQSETNDHSNTRSGNSQTDYWLQNELYNLKKKHKNILVLKNPLLSDSLIDAAQVLICRALRIKSYKSILNC